MSIANAPIRLAVVFCALGAGAARGQSEVSLPVPGVHQIGLLLMPGVQRELKLDEGQAAAAKGLAGQVQQTMIKSIQELQNKGVEERVKGAEAMNDALAADAKAGLEKILKPEQAARLLQISLQERGGMSFADPDVQAALKMSENQKARTKSQVTETFLKVRQFALENPTDRQAAMAKGSALRKELGKVVFGELSPEQQAAWKAMIGEPFEVKFDGAP